MKAINTSSCQGLMLINSAMSTVGKRRGDTEMTEDHVLEKRRDGEVDSSLQFFSVNHDMKT